jgi:CRP/FNR family transcriptional regulator
MDKERLLADLEPGLRSELETHALYKEIPQNTEILREGSYVAGVPIVLSGRIKVFRGSSERELLIYYIQPGESCVMSFFSGLNQIPSEVIARTEEDSELLLLPAEKLDEWIRKYPSFNRFLLNLYQMRFQSLLHRVDQLLFWRLDERVMDYLQEKARTQNTAKLNITHSEIAHDLSTAREVISRVLKKWEASGEIKLGRNTIELQTNQ